MQTLKTALREGVTSKSMRHTEVSTKFRNILHSTTGEPPAVLLLRKCLRTRLDAVKPSVEVNVARHQSHQMTQRRLRTRELQVRDQVRVLNCQTGNTWLWLPSSRGAGSSPTKCRCSKTITVNWRHHQDHIWPDADQDEETPFPVQEGKVYVLLRPSELPSTVQPAIRSSTEASGYTGVQAAVTPVRRYLAKIHLLLACYSPQV